MGSYATLGIGRMEIDWSKNEFLNNHSCLFLPTHRSTRPYYYADNVIEEKPAFVTTLGECKPRLELIGYTLERCRREYEGLKEDQYSDDYYDKIRNLTFDHYLTALKSVDVAKLNPDFEEYGDFDFGEFVARIAFQEPEFNKLIPLKDIGRYEGGEFFTNLGPYLTLRLLMENPKNLGAELVWRYFDIVEAGYFEEEANYAQIAASQKFLLVTEGSSDTFVLESTLAKQRPDIADFFYFVDMQSRYPFTGTGNMVQFAKGLHSIRCQNKIIFVLDNDMEGLRSFDEIRKLALPSNMSVMHLPDLEEIRKFNTVGPNGKFIEDINGRAASIEAYLDLKFGNMEPALVRWKSFVPERNGYQGAIEDKDRFVRAFKSGLASKDYEYSKLIRVVDAVVASALEINDRISGDPPTF